MAKFEAGDYIRFQYRRKNGNRVTLFFEVIAATEKQYTVSNVAYRPYPLVFPKEWIEENFNLMTITPKDKDNANQTRN